MIQPTSRFRAGKATIRCYMAISERGESWLSGRSVVNRMCMCHKMVRHPYTRELARDIHLYHDGWASDAVFYITGNAAYRIRK